MQLYFTIHVNAGRKFRDSNWCPFKRGCCLIQGSLNTGFTDCIYCRITCNNHFQLDRISFYFATTLNDRK